MKYAVGFVFRVLLIFIIISPYYFLWNCTIISKNGDTVTMVCDISGGSDNE